MKKDIVENERFLNINGNAIHVKSIGEGLPIIFAHGGYLNLDMWDVQINEFKDSHQLIRFSDLGHGKTKSDKKTILGYEIISQLTKEDSKEKLVLVGLSWGAMLSVDFALNYPDRVEKLILVSPGLNGWPYFKDSIANENNLLRKVAIQNNDIPSAAKLFHQNWVVGPRRDRKDLTKEFESKSLNMILNTMTNHWMEDWSNLDSIPAIERLEEIKIPTYIIVGDQDAQDILLIADEYKNRISNAKKIVVENVAHLINMENPKKFNDILKRILKE